MLQDSRNSYFYIFKEFLPLENKTFGPPEIYVSQNPAFAKVNYRTH